MAVIDNAELSVEVHYNAYKFPYLHLHQSRDRAMSVIGDVGLSVKVHDSTYKLISCLYLSIFIKEQGDNTD
jgi:hypothetical protein